MNKSVVILFLLLLSTSSYAAVYVGGSYGTSIFSSEKLADYKVSPKGPTYGGFLGYGKEFVGVEVFYQNITGVGDIKHDGEEHKLTTNATAMGAALRFSFELLYLRLGIARYTLDQSVDITNAASRASAEVLYDIQEKNTKKNGVLYGAGIHHGFSWCRVFIDYSRYQINGIGYYNTFSAGMSFNIPEKWFNVGKY